MFFSMRIYSATCICLTMLVSAGRAQGPAGVINGTVTDPSGAVVGDVAVRVSNTETGVARETKTNASGLYSFPELLPGTYTVSAEHAGFKRQIQSNITLQVQQTVRVDFALSVGEVSQAVEVTSSAPLLSTEDATVGQVVENKRITELPLNGRNFLQLTALSPGVSNTSAPSNATSFQGGQRASQSITVNGQRNDFNHFTLDGIENTDPNFNTYVLLPSLDALQEFKVQSATYPAEYGFSVSQINVTTKSGTNQFHGVGFEYLRNSWFDAKNFFDSKTAPIPPFRRNQFGGTFAGPILKNKLFFMLNYEGLRQTKALTIISTVPPATLRTGNFTGLATIYDPLTVGVDANGRATATAFPSNIIPSSRISPTSLALFQFYPVPNLAGTANNYLNNEASTLTGDQAMARVDYQQSEKYNWYARWSYDKDEQYSPSAFPSQGGLVSTRPDQIMGAGTQVLTPNLVNEVRFGWTRFINNNAGRDAFVKNINKDILKIPGINPTDNPAFWGIPNVTITGYSGFGEPTNVYLTNNDLWEVHDTLSVTRGKHMLRLGAVFERIHYNQTGNQFALGGFDFNGTVTANPAVAGGRGLPIADFLLGYPDQSQAGVQPANAALRSNYWAAFFTDTFRLTPKLTLEYGLRYEYLPPFKDINDASSNLYGVNTSSPILVRASNQGTGLDPYQNLAVKLQNITLVRDGRLGPGLVNPDRNNFAPRIGIAYSPTPKTVIRSGFGTYYAVLDMGNSIYDMSRTLAGLLRQSQSVPFPDLSLSSPFRGLGSSGPITLVQPLILANAADIRSTYVNEWSFTIQRSISRDLVFELGYVGSQTHRLKKFTSLNMPQPGPGSIDTRRPWRQYGYVQYPDSIGNGNYNALQLRLEKRFSAGMTLLSTYTYAKSIDDTSGVRATGGDVLTPNNPFCLNSCERARSTFDARHRWVTSGFVELPFGRSKLFRSSAGALENAVLGGWQLGGIFTVQTGMPFTAVAGTDVANMSNGLGITERPDATGISSELANPTPNLWFNKAAFRLQAPFTLGNAGRNTLTGPRVVDLDLSLMKRFRITERLGSELRWDVFNVANHPIFSTPNANLSSAAYGSISGTVIDSRQMQLALRVNF